MKTKALKMVACILAISILMVPIYLIAAEKINLIV